jgi:hypothetical protein
MSWQQNRQGDNRSTLILGVLVAGAVVSFFGLLIAIAFLVPKLDVLLPPVAIVTTAPKGMFPDEWGTDGTRPLAKPLPAKDAPKVRKVLQAALDQYPRLLLFGTLDEVHCVEELTLYGEEYSSTCSYDRIYISGDGSGEWEDTELQRVLHYELAAILYWHRSSRFDQTAWEQSLPRGFEYDEDLEPKTEMEEDRDYRDPFWLSQGFLCLQSAWTIEEDLGDLAESILTGSCDFYAHVRRYPALRKKAELVAEFYRSMGISLPLWDSEMLGKRPPDPKAGLAESAVRPLH